MPEARHTVTSVTPVADMADDTELRRLQMVAIRGWYDIVAGRGWEALETPHAVLHEVSESAGAESESLRSWQVSGWVGPLDEATSSAGFDGREVPLGYTGAATATPSTRDVRVVRKRLQVALAGARGDAAAVDHLCAACVDLLSVGGAALAAAAGGSLNQSLGASSELSRELDELQLTFGEGPCLDAIRERAPVGVSLEGPAAQRWPAFTSAALDRGVRTVLAMPVALARAPFGSLALYCFDDRELDNALVTGALIAADLAALPLLELSAEEGEVAQHAPPGQMWDLGNLSRVEVHQAAGMLSVQLEVGPAEALARLRAYAVSHDLTPGAVGWEIVQRRLRLDDDRRDQP